MSSFSNSLAPLRTRVQTNQSPVLAIATSTLSTKPQKYFTTNTVLKKIFKRRKVLSLDDVPENATPSLKTRGGNKVNSRFIYSEHRTCFNQRKRYSWAQQTSPLPGDSAQKAVMLAKPRDPPGDFLRPSTATLHTEQFRAHSIAQGWHSFFLHLLTQGFCTSALQIFQVGEFFVVEACPVHCHV